MEKDQIKLELKQNERFLKKAYNKALIPCVLSVLSGNRTDFSETAVVVLCSDPNVTPLVAEYAGVTLA